MSDQPLPHWKRSSKNPPKSKLWSNLHIIGLFLIGLSFVLCGIFVISLFFSLGETEYLVGYSRVDGLILIGIGYILMGMSIRSMTSSR